MGIESVSSREDLGRALTDLRVQAGLSVRDVAAEADALLGTVAGWFAGQHAPTRASREMFERVLAVCGITDPAERDRWCEAAARTARRGGRRRPRGECPYRGFESFTADDAGWYFGRDDLTARLGAIVRKQARDRAADLAARRSESADGAHLKSAVIVVGASGVGKSSLVRAGLLSRVGGSGDLSDWRAATMSPGDDPLSALRAAVAELDGAGTPEHPGLLVIDQLEELWTQSDRMTRVAFNTAVARALSGRLIVQVLVLRADFYARITEVPGMVPVFADAQLVVPSMNVDQMREVIVRPAAAAHVAVDDDLVRLLLDDIAPNVRSGTNAGVLPLLSHVLRATWEKSDGRRMTVADYVATGRIGGAVEKSAEDVFTALGPGDQVVARRLLLAMVNVEEEMVTRRRVTLPTWADGDDEPDAREVAPIMRVVAAFAAARLLTVFSSQIYLTHEALLEAWPRLARWIEDDRERLILQRRLRAQSEAWDAEGRADDLLPSRARLEVFEGLLDEEEGEVLDRVSLDFIAAGRERVREYERKERRRSRQLRTVALSAVAFATVAVIAAVIALVAGATASRERNAAEHSRNETLSRQLAIQSGQLAERDPYLAGQLAMVAYQQAPTVEARSNLVATVSSGVPARRTGASGALYLTRAGSLMVAAGASGQVRLFRVGDTIEEQIGEFDAVDRGHPYIGGAALTPDGSRLLIGTAGAIREWDVTDPAHVRPSGQISVVGGDANSLTISPDGQWLAAGAVDRGLRVWRSTSDGWSPVPLTGDVGRLPGALAFSPDSRVLVSGTANQRLDLWRIVGGEVVRVGDVDLGGRENQLAQGAAFSPDGTRLYVSLRTRVIVEFDVTDPAELRRLSEFGGFGTYVGAVDVSDDGSQLVGAGADNTIRVYDLHDRAAPARVMPTASVASTLMFLGDHVIAASDDGRVQDWPPSVSSAVVGPRTVFQIPANAAGNRILAANTLVDGRITRWNVADGRIERVPGDLLPPPGVVFPGSVVQSPDGRVAAIGSVTGTIYFADLSDDAHPQVVGAAAGHPGLNETVDYSAVSGVAVTGGTDVREVLIIDAKDIRKPRTVSRFDAGGGVWWASLSPDGTRLAVATAQGRVRIVDVSDPAHPKAYPDAMRFDGPALSVRFDATGDRIVATSQAKTAEVADISDPANPRRVALMSGSASQLYSAAFSPDGSRVVLGGGNAEIWVWRIDGDDPEVETIIRSFPGTVYDVRFVGDDYFLASGANGLIRSWRLDPTGLIEAECKRGSDEISEAEWRTYIPGEPYRPPCKQ